MVTDEQMEQANHLYGNDWNHRIIGYMVAWSDHDRLWITSLVVEPQRGYDPPVIVRVGRAKTYAEAVDDAHSAFELRFMERTTPLT